VQGLTLFKQELDILFYAQQRVSEDDKECLFKLSSTPNVYLQSVNVFIGINASGKTSVLKAIQLALNIVKNEPINHVDAKTILGGTDKAVFHIYFYDANQNVCCLETEKTSKRIKSGEFAYAIVNEKFCFEQMENKKFIYLKFKGEEIVLNNVMDLGKYLSSGTIKGIITFSMVKEVFLSGGYLLVDEIENHFNKEIICNRNGITAANLSNILKRNDIKKSDAYYL